MAKGTNPSTGADNDAIIKGFEAQLSAKDEELKEASDLIDELKAKLAASEAKTSGIGYEVVKDKEGRQVEVLEPGFMYKRREITLEILKTEPELVSQLLKINSGNVRLKESK